MISNLPESEQHQHPNGHGWVANTARVAKTCFVGPFAIVYGKAEVTGKVCIVDSAQVSGTAKLSGDVIVSGNCWIDHGTYTTGRLWRNEKHPSKAERLRPAEDGLLS